MDNGGAGSGSAQGNTDEPNMGIEVDSMDVGDSMYAFVNDSMGPVLGDDELYSLANVDTSMSDMFPLVNKKPAAADQNAGSADNVDNVQVSSTLDIGEEDEDEDEDEE